MSSKPGRQPHRNRAADRAAAEPTTDYVLAAILLAAAPLSIWYFELPLNVDITAADFNPLTFLPVILGVIGLVIGVKAARKTARSRKFGESTLTPVVARRGSLFRGTVHTSRDIAPTGDFRFTLECLRKRRPSEDFDSGSSIEKTIYRDKKAVPANAGTAGQISFEFLIPSDMPRSGQDKKTKDAIRWIVSVSAPTPGVDYHASFSIQVS